MRITFLAVLAVLLALPATASAKVGDIFGPEGRRFVVIAQGKYPHGRHWFVSATPCGDNLPQHAAYGLWLGAQKETESWIPCPPPGTRNTRLIGWGGNTGGKDTMWKQSVQGGGVDPSVDALKVVVGHRWVRTRLFSLTPEQTAAAGFAPGSKWYVRVSAARRSWLLPAPVGVAAYSDGKLVDCILSPRCRG